MTAFSEKLESEIAELTPREKAALAQSLIEELDGESDIDVEETWMQEAKLRYQAYQDDQLESISGGEALMKAREKLK